VTRSPRLPLSHTHCSWAPYSNTRASGASTFSKGIWKSVYLAAVSPGAAAIEHLAPRVFYNGSYPTAPLSDTDHGDFTVSVAVHLLVPTGASGTGSLTVTGGWTGPGSSVTLPVTLAPGPFVVTATLTATNNAVALWWPAQTPGAQTLYPVTATYTPATGGAAAVVSDTRRVGFRVLAMVTGNDTDPSTLAGRDGSDTFTMRFKVNGANIWSRGANMIPMEELEGRSSDVAHRRLVQSAVEGGFNTFRLWGGGIFQYDAWYDACDEMGMLVSRKGARLLVLLLVITACDRLLPPIRPHIRRRADIP
jgi:beta-mannosidase